MTDQLNTQVASPKKTFASQNIPGLFPLSQGSVGAQRNDYLGVAAMAYTGIHGKIHILAKEEGKLEGKQETLLSLLQTKFGSLPESVTEKVKSASLDKLDAWLTNLILKQSLDQILV